MACLVKPERSGLRDTGISERLECLGLVVSRWPRSFSVRRRTYAYDVPALDCDAMLIDHTTCEPLALFEIKFENAPLSHAEYEVFGRVADQVCIPAFVLRYSRQQDETYFWKLEPQNAISREYCDSDLFLNDAELDCWLRSIDGLPQAPPIESNPEKRLYFPVFEFDHFVVQALIDFRPADVGLSPDFRHQTQFKVWEIMGLALNVPVFAVKVHDDFSWHTEDVLVDLSIMSRLSHISEQDACRGLYSLRGRTAPEEVINKLNDTVGHAISRRPGEPPSFLKNRVAAREVTKKRALAFRRDGMPLK